VRALREESTLLYGLSYISPYNPPHNKRILDEEEERNLGARLPLRVSSPPDASITRRSSTHRLRTQSFTNGHIPYADSSPDP
jgi:hypothetical protein